MQKPANFFEQNVQWFALGIGGLFLAWMLYAYVLAAPNAIDVGGLSVPIDAGRFNLPAPGAPVTLGIRPEDVVPDGHGVRPELGVDFSGPVGFSEMLGNESLLFADFGGAEIVARMSHPRLLGPNENVNFRIDGARVHLFDAQTQNSLRR